MGALSSTSPVQNSASSPTSPSDLNDAKITTETTPKPRKFFKSRNAAPSAEIQQIAFQQQQQLAMQQQMMHSNNHVQHSSDDHSQQYSRASPQKATRKKQVTPKKEKVEKPKVEKPPKVKKERPPKQPKVKEVVQNEPEESDDDEEEEVSPRRGRAQAEGTRSSGRARGRMVNYNEEEGEEEFLIRTEKRIAPRFFKGKHQSEQQQPTTPSHTITTSTIESQNLYSQNSVESSGSSNQAINHPPIVLRISKVSNFKFSFIKTTKMSAR
jgi:hypothetical protein